MNADTWQLPDDEEQCQRDEMMKHGPMLSSPDWDDNHVDTVPKKKTPT
jgi:hypothetical protein